MTLSPPQRAGRTLRLLCAFLAVALSARFALAHKLNVFATCEGAEIHGSAYFSGGEPARNVTVLLLGPEAQKLAESRTDDDGRFVFEAQHRCDHRIVVQSADGHRASYSLRAEELPSHLPAAGGAEGPRRDQEVGPAGPEAASAGEGAEVRRPELEALVENAVARRLRPLREQIERYENRIRLHDVLGGIGYIMGVMGLTFFLTARRREKANDRGSR